MAIEKPEIDPYLFESQFRAFKIFVEEQKHVPFVSFASHRYIDEEENYKFVVNMKAREELSFETWKKSDIGNGNIILSVIKSIEIEKNNLVRWQNRYGETARPHNPLYVALNDPDKLKSIETCFYQLYSLLSG
ncbi:MAG: hypothetical protein JXB48_09620 [Candidatus Latescibacteria bacterium]|nr:hypothetical protein [Candidatus Latescibacterota bacterium]